MVTKKELKESPIGKAKTYSSKDIAEAVMEVTVRLGAGKKAAIEFSERAQCLSIGGDLCSLIGNIMVEDWDKGTWLAEKLTPIIKQLQKGAGIIPEKGTLENMADGSIVNVILDDCGRRQLLSTGKRWK